MDLLVAFLVGVPIALLIVMALGSYLSDDDEGF
jgi:hypothetical protein